MAGTLDPVQCDTVWRAYEFRKSLCSTKQNLAKERNFFAVAKDRLKTEVASTEGHEAINGYRLNV